MLDLGVELLGDQGGGVEINDIRDGVHLAHLCLLYTSNLCIDHHGSNSGYAYETLVDAGAAASAELLTTLIPEMGDWFLP